MGILNSQKTYLGGRALKRLPWLRAVKCLEPDRNYCPRMLVALRIDGEGFDWEPYGHFSPNDWPWDNQCRLAALAVIRCIQRESAQVMVSER